MTSSAAPEPSSSVSSVRSPSVRAEPAQDPAEPDPQAVATAVEACRSVSRLSGGIAGEAATYLPGKRVNGVRIRPGGVAVNVVAHWDWSAEQVATEVRAAVRTAAAASGAPVGRVDVTIDDVEVPVQLVERLGLAEPEPEPEPEQPADAVAAAPGVTVPAIPPPVPVQSSAPAPTRLWTARMRRAGKLSLLVSGLHRAAHVLAPVRR